MPKYLIFDLQGGEFAMGGNKTGGVTAHEIREMACEWLYMDGNETPRQAMRWSLKQIADFWGLEIVRIRKY